MVAANDPNGVEQPQLAELVELARGQRVPTLRVDADTIVRAVAQRRASRTRTLVFGAVLAAAATWVLATRIVPGLTQDRAASVEQAPDVLDDLPKSSGLAVPRTDDGAAPSTNVAPALEPEAPVTPPQTEGEITEAAAAALPTERVTTSSALELAREAERAMADRRRRDAIALLEQLVRKYPTHAAAKAALFDLGRLLREDGRRDEARCAYQMLQKRWPHDSAREEVAKMLSALGDGPACRGLRPIRSR